MCNCERSLIKAYVLFKVLLLAISRLTSCSILPYHGVTVGITPNSAPVHSQYFHEQDKYGQYVYGYASGLHAKDEIKTADGVTRGGYSYIDANGILQTVQYISDPVNGFRVSATNIPRDLPEVALAKVQHYQAYQNIKAEHAYIAAVQRANSPVALSPLPLQNSVVVPISASHVAPVVHAPQVAPVAYLPQAVNYIPLPVSSQYHSQDNYGQYSYGYAGPLSSKTETKTADGVTRGGYSYIDANGILQSVQYVSDPVNGFRVKATNLPEAPVVTLVGPKVSTSVAGPTNQNTLVSSGVHAVSVNPVSPQVNIPVVSHDINSVPVHSQSPNIHLVAHSPYEQIQSVPDRFVNPVVLSHKYNNNDEQAILFNPQVFTQSEHSVVPNVQNPVLTQPQSLSNTVHTIPFPSNGRIITHDNLNVLSNVQQEPINNLNIPQQAHVPLNNPNIPSEIVYQEQHIPNLEHSYGNLPPQALLPPHSQVLNSAGQNSYDAGQVNIPVQSIGEIHQQSQINANPQLFSPLNQAVNIPSGSGNHLINNAGPNYQIPINPEQALGSEAISKDLINGGLINQQSGIYDGQGAFLRGNEGAYAGSIGGGPALYASRQGDVQQVSQTPVNAVPAQQQAFYERAGNAATPLNERRDNVNAGPEYEIQGPTGNPNVQPSGYYTQNIEY